MSIKNFLQEIDKGLTSPVYLLYADNQYLLEEALFAVKRTIPEAETDFNINVFDMDSADETPTPEQITGTLNTVSFFGGRRYVVVKNLQKFPGKDFKKFQPYIANPSPAAALIMLHSGTMKKELKENTKGIKAICLDIREQDLPFWIKDKARQKGLSIKDDAIEYLIGIIGTDIGLLSSEVEKLACIGNETITINDIREIVEGSRDYSAFDLTRALREKDAPKVFRIYKVLSETAEPYTILGAINWQYSQMFIQTKDKNSREDYFHKAFELLNDADIRIKSSGGAYPLEYLLVRLLKL
ncbi:MAG: DNA polymerase III subunit delta [Thermodesulfovibrionales bacterium]|nr:DNA polymerase III subunit delta [Thermodesulfovibrionales bacterium]MDP3112185.1 DNA polymerase III subunit delta [Thermodesulfovibrionales bacterium]